MREPYIERIIYALRNHAQIERQMLLAPIEAREIVAEIDRLREENAGLRAALDAERERCARIAETEWQGWWEDGEDDSLEPVGAGAMRIARLIRQGAEPQPPPPRLSGCLFTGCPLIKKCELECQMAVSKKEEE